MVPRSPSLSEINVLIVNIRRQDQKGNLVEISFKLIDCSETVSHLRKTRDHVSERYHQYRVASDWLMAVAILSETVRSRPTL